MYGGRGHCTILRDLFRFLSGGSTALDESLPAVTMVWQYIGQLMFNMLVLTGLVKGSDRLVHEMLGA